MKNMYYIEDITTQEEILKLIPRKSILFFDTESSFVHENKDIPMRLEDNKFNPLFKFDVHVYAWAIANDRNDNVIYGHNLTQFMDFLYTLNKAWFTDKIYTNKSYKSAIPALEIWVHNLNWDLEFIKYELERQKYFCENSKVSKSKQKIMTKISPGHYNIIENYGIVYGAIITHKKRIKVNYKEGDKTKYVLLPIEIKFNDSLKISNTSLEDIAKNLISLPAERLKIEGYDYSLHRPLGHVLTEEEQEYLYNDVYILKEWYNQYYTTFNTTHKTASGIAFERICKKTYGEDFTYNKHFLEDFPYSLNYLTNELINDSYKGGITQVNRKYVNEIKNFNTPCVAVDIVSSYPSVLVNKPLPKGLPILSYNFESNKLISSNPEKYIKELKKLEKEGKLILLKIAFDGFKNNDPQNLFGEIQIGSSNREEFKKYFPSINSGQEYIHTNIIDNNLIGGNLKHDNYRYVKTYWTFELNSILKNTTFYTGEQQYCAEREDFYFADTLNLEEGYKILGAVVFEATSGHFAPGILDGYNKKNEGKQEGNKIKESSNKLFINSFYGKLGANPERIERFSFLNEDNGLMEFRNTDILYYDNKRYYKAMASCVTAWGRCNLRDTIYQIGINNVMYVDTDSAWTTLTKEEIEQKIPNKLNDKLGFWSMDYEYNKFKAIGSKKYIFNGRKLGKKDKPFTLNCRCAGLPNDARETQTFDTFELGAVIEGKKVKHKVPGGYALIEGSYTINNNTL